MKYLFTFLLGLISMVSAFSQKNKRLLTGMIISESGHRPLEGAMVWVKGTKNYSGAQPDGVYFVQVKPSDSVLVVSYQDHETVEVKLTGETEYNVVLRGTAVSPASFTSPRTIRRQKITSH